MSELTLEELARVARVCGGDSYLPWKPDFNGPSRQRSQALAIVEHLAKYAYAGRMSVLQYLRAITDKDIETLQRMVIELGEL